MITKSIPSLITVGNLFLGIAAIMLVFHGNPELAALMVIFAMLLDGVDGRIARALDAQTDFGKELDSLSDVISFGVAPAFGWRGSTPPPDRRVISSACRFRPQASSSRRWRCSTKTFPSSC
jgi:phosphatidylglycerophosphate synthase